MNFNEKTFWSQLSLNKKIGIWNSDQVKNFFVPLIDLQANEIIYDIGCGFSPLGTELIPFLLPNGLIKGFDNNPIIVEAANENSKNQGLSKYLSFSEGDVYSIDDQHLPLADLVMCQQLLVNLADPVTAFENMLNVCKSTGRILCIENVNYGAYVYRPDFSSKTNLELSQIWQTLCTAGKFGFDYGDTTFGANLPQIFYELGLHDISWQIISSGANIMPPYTNDFKKSFLNNLHEEKTRIKELILSSWGPKTELTDSKIHFFIDQLITSDYDEYAINHNLFLTQWFYPFMVIVGWLQPKNKKLYSENLDINI